MKNIILDLDTGIDDTLALAYILGSPDANLLGVTATYGNVLLEQSVKNTLDVLALFGRADIPVYAGQSHPLESASFTVPESSGRYHGANGLGGAHVPVSATRQVEETSAVDFIIESVRADTDGSLVYVPTGPSTNLALAFAKAPDIIAKIKVVMMGGSLTLQGNTGPFAEANMAQDPEASAQVFDSGADITMVGLDVTTRARMGREHLAALRELGTPAGNFLAEMTEFYINVTESDDPGGLEGCNLHDPLAAAVALDEDVVWCFPINVLCETEGPSRGRTIGDPGRAGQPSTTRVALDVDERYFVRHFMQRLLALAAAH
ncbi:purine nucleosidase [Actinobaculum suis]|uniref:Nucleoside hydrolase n=1 Tax=Actinobaculum suis TaxID=1657 RepID=A0A1G7C1G6_9ACTO|nr:nucleoside hydrolase [Actinobaculum suis]MDY5153124.1 nucleoside hydrolase [Actinobaculum suis]SDE33119.1 purine nucleosidase [Actinobaculum suis]